MTLQTLIIKVLYLLYAQEHTATYTAISDAVRVCYLIGLHVQSLLDTSPFELHMRQRIFWSLYCLERNVAQVCGMPHLLRDSEILVEMPVAFDDRFIGKTEHLPESSAETSPVPYLCHMVDWARLSCDIWDKVFCVSAKKPLDDDFLVVMDARLEHLRNILPPKLQWKARSANTGLQWTEPQYLHRQAMILHLVSAPYITNFLLNAELHALQRINHLRLQLRREDVLSDASRSRDVPVCLALAEDTIKVVHDFYSSTEILPLHRYSCATYLVGCIIALSSIILGGSGDENVTSKCQAAFGKALSVIRAIAPGVRAARAILSKLGRIIHSVEHVRQTSQQNDAEGLDGPELVELSHGEADMSGSQTLPMITDHLDILSKFDQYDSGPLRMMFTPAFNTHYWDAQMSLQ